MAFEQIFKNLFDAMKTEFKDDMPKVEGYLLHILNNNKAALAKITNYYMNGEYTDEEYEKVLRRNMLKIQDQMLAIKVMKKKAIQDAVNAGIDVVMKAIKLI